MTNFTEKIRRKGQAEEDIYFARLDRQLIQALHDKQSPPSHEKPLGTTDIQTSDIRVKSPDS